MNTRHRVGPRDDATTPIGRVEEMAAHVAIEGHPDADAPRIANNRIAEQDARAAALRAARALSGTTRKNAALAARLTKLKGENHG